MTDAEIVKALECCANEDIDCEDCPSKKCCDGDTFEMVQAVLDLIKRQKAEIERLNKEVDRLSLCVLYHDGQIADAKAEAIKELREKCIEHQDFHKGDDGKFRGYIAIEDLDYIISEI